MSRIGFAPEGEKEMRMSGFTSRTRLVAAITAGLATASLIAGAAAQTPASPPDFSSGGVSWGGGVGINFKPVAGAVPPTYSDPAHPHYNNAEARRLGVAPTYRIADLTNPNIKQWAKDIMKKDNDEVLAGKIGYTPGSSCRPAGTPTFMEDGGPFYFLQTPKVVLIVATEDSQVRHVYMNVPHSRNPKPSYFGESVGHYEGDTLVVDTIGQNTKTFVDQYRTPHSEKLHVIERWRKINDGKAMEVEVTVEDPDTFVQPWKGTVSWPRQQEGYTEVVCSEGNHNIFDWHIPEAKTPDF